MSEGPLSLQVGGTLNPRKHIYIQRPEDEKLLEMLTRGQFCNVLSPRQMGKSSLMARTVYRLREMGIGAASIDLAGDLGTPQDSQDWYIDLIGKLSRDLRLDLDAESWWRSQVVKTDSQKLLMFLGQALPQQFESPLVIFLDEIDSTLRLPYADNLFLSIRTLNNDRPLQKCYERVTFCLLGVATPNELIKSREATSYNVGQTLELRDFDEDRDDLSSLRHYLGESERMGGSLLRRVLFWTGGQPYLTTKLCKQIVEAGATDAAGVDAFTQEMLSDWDRLGSDVHFQQVERFLSTRVSESAVALDLYERIRTRELDKGTQPHIELRLSGLVKRGEDGALVVRNRIYERVFDLDWVRKHKPPSKLEHKPEESSAYRAFSRDVRRFTYPTYVLTGLLLLVTAALAFFAFAVNRQLRTPQASVLLSSPEATRSAGSDEPVVVPAGVRSFVMDLAVESDQKFPEYQADLTSEQGELIWRGNNIQASPLGRVILVFSRSFLPAGKYQILLYGLPGNGPRQLIASYPMPLVYAEVPAQQ
jgi:AAA-like domain